MKTHRFNSNQASPAKPRPASAMARVQVSLTWRGESFSIGKLEPADWLTVWKSIIAARVDSAKQTAADFDWLPYEIGGKAVESAAKRIHDTEPSPTEAATWIAVNASEIVYLAVDRRYPGRLTRDEVTALCSQLSPREIQTVVGHATER